MANKDAEKYQLLIRHLPNAFAYHRVLTDDDGEAIDYVFLEVNAPFEEMTGLKRESIIGKKVTEVLPGIEKDQSNWISILGRVALSGESTSFEGFSKPLQRWYAVNAYSDEPGFFVTVFKELTARKKIESALSESESKFKRIFDLSVDGHVLFDGEKYIDCNDASVKMLGYSSKSDLLALSPQEISPQYQPDGRLSAEKAQEMIEIAREKGTHLFEWVCVRTDGSLLYLEAQFNCITLQGKKVIHGVWRDISERKLAEETLRLNSIILDQIQDHVIMTDLKGDILYANNAEVETLKMPRDAIVGKNIEMLGENPEKGATQREIREMTIKNGAWRGEVINYSAEGRELVLDCRTQVVHDEAGKPIGLCGIATDITDRKKAEDEIRTLNEGLEQRVRERTAQLEAANHELNAFAYSVSHDLRGPLNRISGFCEALLEDYSGQLDHQGRDYLRRIINSSWHMAELIEDLLKLSKVSQAQISLEPVEISALVNIYLKELQDREPHRQVETVITPGLVVEADTAMMRIALANLLNNAWKFSAGEEVARIEFGSTVQDDREVYYIRDNGIGFDMDQADRLFNAFQRLHDTNAYPGTGIGLSIVARVISRHGGTIWAEGEPGQGACFYFTLQ